MCKLFRPVYLRGVSAVFGLLFCLMVVSPANAQSTTTTAPLAGCNTVEVTLHGTGAPASTCLDSKPGVVSPQVFARVCKGDGSDLIIYWNGPIDVAHGIFPSGPKLCIRGNGTLNLAVTQPDGRNWNDKASAWWAGCSNGEFWLNAGHNWPWEGSTFDGGNGTFAPSGNFPYGNVGNDQLSQVELYSNC